MKKFEIVIRDDDLCSFSNFDMHLNAIEFYKNIGCEVIVGLVPNSIEVIDDIGIRYYSNSTTNRSLIYRNPQFIEYVNYLKLIGCQIYAHGFTHQYLNNNIHSEYGEFSSISKDESKNKFKEILDCFRKSGLSRPQGFIPPSNRISLPGLLTCAEYFDNISYLLPTDYRMKSIRLFIDALIKKSPINNKSLCMPSTYRSLEIEPYISFSRKKNNSNDVISYVALCKKYNLRAVIATHYWEIADIKYRNLLSAIVNEFRQ